EMTNHPNRSRGGSPSRNPDPAEIKAAREAAGLSATEAATLLHTSYRAWKQWEDGDRRMHPAFWELFLLKAV
ncbi:helix-turn-helix domain-containing protein, partial [Propionivibrio sp.]|uniref:helix-turn-helix domain-containing protein n=1 Tax=Propionivibrio sp. TaxID=2212460 RepID=UPI0025EFF968